MAAPGQPRTGTYPAPQSQVRRPVSAETDNQPTNTYNAYARPTYQPEQYFRPVDHHLEAAETTESPEVEATQQTPRVGRRTAYRQAQQDNQENHDE